MVELLLRILLLTNTDLYKKDGPRAIYNPKYKQKIELLLQDIVNRGLTEKNIYYVDGKEITMQVKPGDKVIYAKYSGTEVEVDGQSYVVVKQNDILAVIQ